MQKNPGYAPIYNTAGLVQNELGKINLAVQFFSKAAQLDPTFFEAQMNYGEVNLSFRGFQPAEGAFRKALAMRPNDYGAHLGLALALRGLITDSNYDRRRRSGGLSTCKKLDPSVRTPSTRGHLTQEFKASRRRQGQTKAALKQAITILKTSRGGVRQVRVRRRSEEGPHQDANDIITFLDADALPAEPAETAGGATEHECAAAAARHRRRQPSAAGAPAKK
jgi:tetratricopeptide (TPR) repeat protein